MESEPLISRHSPTPVPDANNACFTGTPRGHWKKQCSTLAGSWSCGNARRPRNEGTARHTFCAPARCGAGASRSHSHCGVRPAAPAAGRSAVCGTCGSLAGALAVQQHGRRMARALLRQGSRQRLPVGTARGTPPVWRPGTAGTVARAQAASGFCGAHHALPAGARPVGEGVCRSPRGAGE